MTRLDIRALDTFRTAAAHSSFSRAAERLGLVQSSVTEQMKRLEADLGVQLFERTGRGVRVTEAGERLRAYADRILALADETETAFAPATEIAGTVTIGAAETICTYRLPPLMKRFKQSHPRVTLRFVPTSVRVLKRHIAEHRFDAAFILEDIIGQDGIGHERLCTEPVVLIAAPDHRLAASPSITARDLAGETVFLTEPGCDYRNRFERALIKAGAHPGQGAELYSIETVKACVAMGLGIAPLPKVAVERSIEAGDLIALNWRDEKLDVATHLVWPDTRWRSPASDAFLLLAREMLAEPKA